MDDLFEAERTNYLAYFNDGLAEITAGLVVCLFGLGMTFDQDIFFIFNWMPLLFFWPLKRWITFSRMGYVKFSPNRQRKISKNFVWMFVFGVLVLLLGVVVFLGTQHDTFSIRDLMDEYGLLVFGFVMASGFFLLALLFEANRFYIYGLMVFAGWLVPILLGYRAWHHGSCFRRVDFPLRAGSVSQVLTRLSPGRGNRPNER